MAGNADFIDCYRPQFDNDQVLTSRRKWPEALTGKQHKGSKMQSVLQSIAQLIRAGEYSQALTESKNSTAEEGFDNKKVQCYLLLKNTKFTEADSLCSKLLQAHGLDHELLCWRGIAKSELSLWHSAIKDLRLSAEIFPLRTTENRIDITTSRACRSISEGMQMDGGTFNDFMDRAKIYLLKKDYVRADRDLKSAAAIDPGHFELYKANAQVQVNCGASRLALDQIEKYLEHDGTDLDLILLKAKIKADEGKLRASLAVLRGLTSRTKSDEESQLKIGNCQLSIRDFHGAIDSFNRALAVNPTSAGALFGRGKSNHEIRNYKAAVADFDAAIEHAGQNPIFLAGLGESKLAAGSNSAASRAFKDAMKIDKRCWEARLGYAKVKNARGKLADSLPIVTEILKNDPDNSQALHFLGSLHFDEQKYEAAVEGFSKSISCSSDPHFKSANYYRRGTAHLENNQIPDAVSDFDKALRLRPFHVGTMVWRGYAYGKLGKWAAAISDLQSAIDLNPMASDQYKKLGEFIAEQAIKHFGAVIRENKTNAEAYYNRGMANLFLQKNDRAYLDFEQALEINPKHSEAQVRLGTLYLSDNQSKKAYSFFTNAAKAKSSANTLLLRAEAMLQLGVIQPALIDIRDAIRTSLNNDRLYVRRGELHVAKGNSEKAIDDFTLSIALNFDNFQAFRERGKLFLQQSKHDEAIRDFTMSLHFYPNQATVLVDRANAFMHLEDYESAAADYETAITKETILDAYIGRAKAMSKIGKVADALSWLTKAIHRFKESEQWAQIVKCRAEIFLQLGRFERANADARIASKLSQNEVLSADCYYIRALASFYHRDREHSEKTLVKALALDSNHQDAELALDWFRDMADDPPIAWQNPPEKVRPTRPKKTSKPVAFEVDSESLEAQPPFDLWLVKSGEEDFGPVPLKTVVGWIKEGRVSTSDLLFRTDWGKWKSVAKTFPELKPHTEAGRESVGKSEEVFAEKK